MINEPLKALVASTAVGLLLVLGGCTDKASPDNVDRRAVERWNDLIEHKAEKAYDYLSPGYRATQDRDAYAASMNNRPVQWKEVKFNRKECEAERCKVYVDVTYTLPLAALSGKSSAVSTTQGETWILLKGEWYYLPK